MGPQNVITLPQIYCPKWGDIMPSKSQRLLARSLGDEYDADKPEPEPHFFHAIGPSLDSKPGEISKPKEEQKKSCWTLK